MNRPRLGMKNLESSNEKNRQSHIGKRHSEETKEKMSESHKKNKNSPWFRLGENHHRWIKDRSLLKKKQERNDSAYQVFVKQVKNRDDWKCKMNNEDCKGYCIVHHILPWREFPELRYEINNGITLCHFHHPRKRVEEKRLIPFFQSMVEVIRT